MKILALNLPQLDLSFYTKKGLNLEVEYQTINHIFPLKSYGTKTTQDGRVVPISTPDLNEYLDENFKEKKYSIILVGWNPADYGTDCDYTGGLTSTNKLKNGAFCASVRLGDSYTIDFVVIHELMHCFVNITQQVLKHYGKFDEMDITWINGVAFPYYKNDQRDAPDGNFSRTWNNIKPFLNELNAITYDPTVTLTRKSDNSVETLGQLEYGNFICKTIERPYKNNIPNISCIPKGVYKVKYTFSLKFLKYTYEIQSVPNRSGIRIHSANYFFDLNGCIALGDSFTDLNKDGQIDVSNSRNTIKKFEELLLKKPFTLIIK